MAPDADILNEFINVIIADLPIPLTPLSVLVMIINELLYYCIENMQRIYKTISII